jgi:predicted amidophosphoribosyltransferase
MAHVLGEALAFQVLAAVDENRLPMPDAIIPMPVHWSRAWMRGIDHTRELADALGASLNRPVKRHLRVRLAVRQAGTTRTQRLANRGRYEFRYPSRWAHPAAARLARTCLRISLAGLRLRASLLGLIWF